VLALGSDEERRIESEYLRKSDGREKISTLREEMQHTMEAGAGIYRVRASIAAAADKIADMQERYKAISMEDHSRTFNTQLIAALELGFLLDVAETILQCALQREESRGAHQRIDFPERDDKRFLAHSLVSRGPNGRPVVSYLPVTITRWPPGKRVYGEQSKDGGHDSH
jgi:fumarate reductase flavoprotein subunit